MVSTFLAFIYWACFGGTSVTPAQDGSVCIQDIFLIVGESGDLYGAFLVLSTSQSALQCKWPSPIYMHIQTKLQYALYTFSITHCQGQCEVYYLAQGHFKVVSGGPSLLPESCPPVYIQTMVKTEINRKSCASLLMTSCCIGSWVVGLMWSLKAPALKHTMKRIIFLHLYRQWLDPLDPKDKLWVTLISIDIEVSLFLAADYWTLLNSVNAA